MAPPDPSPHEARARQALADAVAEGLHTTGFPVHAMVSEGAPNASELKSLLARDTGAPTSAPLAAAQGRRRNGRPVSEMSGIEKVVEAFELSDIDETIREEILAAIAPRALAISILASAAMFAASQFTPVGWAADIVIGGLTVIFVGTAVLSAAHHLIQFADAANATTDEQLYAAGHAFAQACADIGVNGLLYLITKKAGGTGSRPPASASNAASVVLAERNGQIVAVAVDTIPDEVAAVKLGLTGRGGPPGSSGGGGGGSGGGKPPGDVGGLPEAPKPRKTPAAPRGRVFRRGFLNFQFEATEEAWQALEAMPNGYAVYLVRNASGEVIYVGVTERGWVRWGEHLAEKGGEWLGQASRFEFVAAGLDTEKMALALEDFLMSTHPNSFNTQWTYLKKFGMHPEPADIPKADISIVLDLLHM